MDTLEQLLDEYDIDYITKGQNSSKDYVNVGCEGYECEGDQKYKRGIHRSMTYSYCWACGKGSSIFYFVKKLGIPWNVWCEAMAEASEEWGTEYSEPEPITDIEDHEPEIFMPGAPLQDIHIRYLRDVRGFDPDWLQDQFGIQGTLYEPYVPGELNLSYRVMIPVHYQGKIISYLGRSVKDDGAIRYICCPPEKELRFHKALFFNIDRAKSKKVILVEGAFDALKLIQASNNYNIIASYGTAIKPQQLKLLRDKYDEVIIVFDNEDKAQGHAEDIKAYMEQFGKKAISVCLKEDADPGSLSLDVAKFLVEALLGKEEKGWTPI
jgi:5S rRNA maturation endonuclease (ribonuclease M5)